MEVHVLVGYKRFQTSVKNYSLVKHNLHENVWE
jgi:hypothetical protein